MAVLEKSVIVEAPQEATFGMMQPERLVEWLIGLEEVFDLDPPPRVGREFKWRYRMAGIVFTGRCIVDVYDPPRAYGDYAPDGIPFHFHSTYEPLGPGRTKLTVRIEYTVPGRALGRLVDKLVIERMNDQKLESSLATLKMIAEREAAEGGAERAS
jgi:hypothetical protein